MTRFRSIVVVALLVLLQLAVVTTPADADIEGFSRLRITLSTTSGWARVALTGIDVRVDEATSLTPGTEYYAKGSGWTIVPPGPDGATAVIDMVIESAGDTDPAMLLRKGKTGTATVQIEVDNGRKPKTIVAESLETNDTTNELSVPVDAATLDLGGLTVTPVDDRRLTLAFYYPWFGARTHSDRSIGPDKPTAPYATDDAASVAGMVNQARSAGVDGFIVSWSGTRHAGSVELLFDAMATEPDFLVTPVIELPAFRRSTLLLGTRFDAAAAAEATRDFFERAPDGSTVEVDGRPAVIVFGMWDLSAAEWASYLAHLAELDPFVVGDRRSGSHQVDGLYAYDPNGLDQRRLENRSQHSVNEARLRPLIDPSREAQLWAATVSPGLDTRVSQPFWAARHTPRNGGARYDMTWQVALRSEPDWVFVTSWNEWYEQTHIAPGTRTGRRALDQTAHWTSRF